MRSCVSAREFTGHERLLFTQGHLYEKGFDSVYGVSTCRVLGGSCHIWEREHLSQTGLAGDDGAICPLLVACRGALMESGNGMLHQPVSAENLVPECLFCMYECEHCEKF